MLALYEIVTFHFTLVVFAIEIMDDNAMANIALIRVLSELNQIKITSNRLIQVSDAVNVILTLV